MIHFVEAKSIQLDYDKVRMSIYFLLSTYRLITNQNMVRADVPVGSKIVSKKTDDL